MDQAVAGEKRPREETEENTAIVEENISKVENTNTKVEDNTVASQSQDASQVVSQDASHAASEEDNHSSFGDDSFDLPPPPLAAGLCEVDGVVISEAMAKLIPSNPTATVLIINASSSTSGIDVNQSDIEQFLAQFGAVTLTENADIENEFTAEFADKASAVKTFIGCHPKGTLPTGAVIYLKWQAEADPLAPASLGEHASSPPDLEKLPYGLLPTICVFAQDEKAPLAFTYAYLYTVFGRYHPYNINMTPDKKAVYCSVHSEDDANKAVEQLGPIFGPRGYNVSKTLM